MKNRITFYLFLVMTMFPSDFLFSDNKSTLIDFELEDQFDKVHKKSDYGGKIIVIVSSDRSGSDYNSQWVEPLYDSLRVANLHTEVSFIGVANLGAVPFFMKSMVQGFFPKDTTNRILMDWDDLFAETYSFKEDYSNLAVFGDREELVCQYAVKTFNYKLFKEIISEIKKSVKNKNDL